MTRAGHSHAATSARRAAWLVARREIIERGRDRTFQTATALSLVVVIGIVLLSSALSGGDDRFTVAVVRGDAESARIADSAQTALRATGTALDVRQAASLQAARQDVRDDQADAALVGAGAQVIVVDDLDAELAQALGAAVVIQNADAQLARAGIDSVARRTATAPPSLAVRALDADDGGAAGVAFVAALLLYGQLITFGVWVANGIAEEKGSRVVELLLSATRSLNLLVGKVVGIGVLGLVQLVLIGLVGLAAAALLDVVTIDGSIAVALAATLGFFVIGYALYAALFAVAGALVSRQEDVQSTTTPLVLILVVAFVVAIQALQDPGSAIASAGALVPFSSPMVMPSRLITGDADATDAALAIALLLLTAAMLLAVAARVYDTAVLRTGARVSLREALAGQR